MGVSGVGSELYPLGAPYSVYFLVPGTAQKDLEGGKRMGGLIECERDAGEGTNKQRPSEK